MTQQAEQVTVDRWGRVNGALHTATTWYQADPHGSIELPGHPGKWRVVAATVLPPDAERVDEATALAEVAAINATHAQRLADSRAEAAERAVSDATDLQAAGIPASIAARIAARLGG